MTDEVLFQFDLAWALADLHLSALVEADFLWEPAPLCWNVRPDAAGVWRPDWADAEPDPLPVPTIGWLTWHIDWWWSTAIDHLAGATPRDHTDVTWPGSGAAAVARLRELAARGVNCSRQPAIPPRHRRFHGAPTADAQSRTPCCGSTSS